MNLNPISKNHGFCRVVWIRDFVLENAAVFLNGSLRGDVIFRTTDEHPTDSKLLALEQGETNHLGRIAFAALTRSDAISNMPTIQ